MKKKILFVFGTRPEAIKLAPLIHEFKKFGDLAEVRVCISAQHREMLDQILGFFEITPDYDLNIMKKGQNLFDITSMALTGAGKVIREYSPDWVVVQGDTSTTFAASLAAYYLKTKVAHIEAGLRSFDKYAPFPEEMNRVMTSRIADLHLAPTEKARDNLLKEGVPAEDIHMVGNTVIDALFAGVEKVSKFSVEQFGDSFVKIAPDDLNKKIILVTGHRRENFGQPFMNICNALKRLAQRDDIIIIYPVHLNPNVRGPVFGLLKDLRNVYLIDPLDYPAFIWLMKKSWLILTDSGGVQEEAPSLGKPVLVMRDVTERTEGIDAGTAKLVGADEERIVRETSLLLDDQRAYAVMANRNNPYGDGRSSQRIREVLLNR